jgi:cell wall-associated NlpC family hydrolase
MTPVEIARTQLDKPWQHQARGPFFWDCIGLTVLAYAAWGIKDFTDYDREPRDGQLERKVADQFGPPVPNGMRENDLVLIGAPRVIRHVGIIANRRGGGFNLIHTSGSTQCVTEHIIDKTWLRLIKRVHRLPELVT